MATEKKAKEGQVEVLFTDNINLDGMPYSQGKTAMLSEADAENLIMSGYAVMATDEMKMSQEQRRTRIHQNRPLAEQDVVIATHDSGEQVAYPDFREKGPLDKNFTPTSVWSTQDTLAAGGSVDAHRLAEERNKGVKGGRRIEELPIGDMPTGVPLGNLEQAQAHTKGLKPNTSSSSIVIDSEEAANARAIAVGDEEEGAKRGTKKSRK